MKKKILLGVFIAAALTFGSLRPPIAAAGNSLASSFGQDMIKEAEPEAEATFLFVCEHGAAKSVIAAAHFNKLAEERRLKYRAIFRGTDPDPALAAAVEKDLEEQGVDTRGWKPQKVAESEMEAASRIITFGCTLPGKSSAEGKVTDWRDVPSTAEDYGLARDKIRRRVEKLVDELAEKGGETNRQER